MEVIRHGKTNGVRLVCTTCSCEFICHSADVSFRSFEAKSAAWRATVKCPECGECINCTNFDERQ